MLRPPIIALALGLTSFGVVSANELEQVRLPDAGDQYPLYVQVIVKACPHVETPLEPVNHGKSYNDEKPLSLEERKATLSALGCIDVPIPMEWLSSEMTPQACRGSAGYLAAMQFIEQRQDLKKEFPAVGAWQCLITDHQVIGAASQ